MFLRTQDEKAIFDFDKYGFISANEKGQVFIGGTGDTGFTIGEYKTEKRAKEVIEDIYISLERSRYDMPIV